MPSILGVVAGLFGAGGKADAFALPIEVKTAPKIPPFSPQHGRGYGAIGRRADLRSTQVSAETSVSIERQTTERAKFRRNKRAHRQEMQEFYSGLTNYTGHPNRIKAEAERERLIHGV